MSASIENTLDSYGKGLGAELVTNGTFTTVLTPWTQDAANWSYNSDHALCDGTGGNLKQNILTLQSGHTYRFIFTIGGRTTGTITPFVGGSANGTTRSANGTYQEDIVHAGDLYIYLQPGSSFDGWVDDVSVQEVL